MFMKLVKLGSLVVGLGAIVTVALLFWDRIVNLADGIMCKAHELADLWI